MYTYMYEMREMADLFPSRWLLPPSFSLYPDDAAILHDTSLDSAPVPNIITTLSENFTILMKLIVLSIVYSMQVL